MSKDERRWAAERSAASIEWYLDRPNADGALGTDPSLAPRAADRVIEVMEKRYGGLAAWVAVTEVAAEAEAAFQAALKWGATKVVLDTLRESADKAAEAFANTTKIDADNPEKVLRAYGAMKRLSATRPDGY